MTQAVSGPSPQRPGCNSADPSGRAVATVYGQSFVEIVGSSFNSGMGVCIVCVVQ
jgi:hypothetical protein